VSIVNFTDCILDDPLTTSQATNRISGTSMATPHVTGLIAVIISISGNKTPAEMTKVLQACSLKGYIRDVREWGQRNSLRWSVRLKLKI